MATRQEDIYAEDLYCWTQDQAAALRRLAETRWNSPLDLEHLAEEVEDLGRSTRTTVRSQLQRIIEHCLKLEHVTLADPRSGWMRAAVDARAEMVDRLTRTLRPDVEANLQRLYTPVRRMAALALIGHGEPQAADALPEECPYGLDQLSNGERLPEDGQRSSHHA